MKKLATLVIVSILGGLISIGAYKIFFESRQPIVPLNILPPIVQTSFNTDTTESIYADFTTASEKSLHAVVHVKNLSIAGPNSMFEYVFGNNKGYRPQVGTGSGVIISPDGYIVTNNHVVKNSSKLEVTLNNNKTYPAKIIGTDLNNDIALLKIDTNEKLPSLAFGDSDNIKVGEWVLAIGNPFNLNSTVTAGIVSAKARDLNPSDNKKQSFIQTDAAINPGNSGGALVNTHGNLIGINTAISSNTGRYIGYSFAVPSNIVKKVIQDLIEFGNVQQVILGVQGSDLNTETANRIGVDQTEGFYISDVEADSGAEKAGVRNGDIIKQIDYIKINKFADLSGYLSAKRPKETVQLIVIRDGKTRELKVTLSKNNSIAIPSLGISVTNMSKKALKPYKTDYGVKISTATRRTNAADIIGKVITKINGKPIHNAKDVQAILGDDNVYLGGLSLTLANKNGEVERLFVR